MPLADYRKLEAIFEPGASRRERLSRLTIRCRQQPLPLPVAIDFMKFVCHFAFQRPARRLAELLSLGCITRDTIYG